MLQELCKAKIRSLYFVPNLQSKKSIQLCLQYNSFENTVGKGEIARNEQFPLFPQCFLTIWKTFCQLPQIENRRMQTLSVFKGLKFVVWERVKTKY